MTPEERKTGRDAATPRALNQPPRVPALDQLPYAELERMREAGEEIRECHRVLKKGGLNIVGELLKGHGTFYELNHYPPGDVYDADSYSQYYYHAHRGLDGEHGHFHSFVRARGMPPGVSPVAYDGQEQWPSGEDALSHLVAISMDRQGFPLGLFATNRWVTAETWYACADVSTMLERFAIDHAYPSWPTNRWITAMFRLFRPQALALLEHRDAVVADWQHAHPGEDVYEDRRLEITGALAVSVESQMARVESALARGRGRAT